ncbi:MauE/DoxX family redox-associated membrane protein [Micromonospora sp. CPCC 206061]|uniref:MauE/DoxX family redox-associated membrane protein n=1 Tax=Micromonospora sp. CPCC 206061 TaxID=3122410 RepID=UPI002FF34097
MGVAAVVAAILTVSGVLAISIIGKVRTRVGFHAFADAITGLQVISPRWSRLVAAASIAAETFVLALLVWPGGAPAGLAAAVLLFGAFAFVLARAIRRGSTVGCHCFGPTSAPVAWRHVIRSGFLAVASFGALLGTIALPAVSLGSLDPPQLLLALFVAGIVVMALVWLDDLTWLLRGATHAR